MICSSQGIFHDTGCMSKKIWKKVTVFQRWTGSNHTGQGLPLIRVSLSLSAEARHVKERARHVLETTGGAEERKQGCQQTILNNRSKPQNSARALGFFTQSSPHGAFFKKGKLFT